MARWTRVCLLGALVAAGCAKAGALVEDGGGTGGNGVGDPGGAADAGVKPDLAMLLCGDGVCSPANGEMCANCPADCGQCAACPSGYADCNSNQADGCETNLSSPSSCGGCGRVCQQAGGTNGCVLVGGSYTCVPACDATHGDCDGDPNNGCETDLTGPNNCGACGHACTNAHGTTVCTTQGGGWFCNPTCTSGWGACGADNSAGCTTDVGGDPDHCGDCSRACSAANATSRSCAGGVCAPACAAPFSDCSRPGAPAADNGCETNGTVDPGENDNACGGQSSTTNEGGTTTITTNRILPAGDTDTFHVHLSEGSHTCFPGTGQDYNALIELVPAGGADLELNYNIKGCDNTWKNDLGRGVCANWSGTCGGSDDRDYYFQVYGVAGANSCANYTLKITYASEGKKVAGCP